MAGGDDNWWSQGFEIDEEIQRRVEAALQQAMEEESTNSLKKEQPLGSDKEEPSEPSLGVLDYEEEVTEEEEETDPDQYKTESFHTAKMEESDMLMMSTTTKPVEVEATIKEDSPTTTTAAAAKGLAAAAAELKEEIPAATATDGGVPDPPLEQPRNVVVEQPARKDEETMAVQSHEAVARSLNGGDIKQQQQQQPLQMKAPLEEAIRRKEEEKEEEVAAPDSALTNPPSFDINNSSHHSVSANPQPPKPFGSSLRRKTALTVINDYASQLKLYHSAISSGSESDDGDEDDDDDDSQSDSGFLSTFDVVDLDLEELPPPSKQRVSFGRSQSLYDRPKPSKGKSSKKHKKKKKKKDDHDHEMENDGSSGSSFFFSGVAARRPSHIPTPRELMRNMKRRSAIMLLDINHKAQKRLEGVKSKMEHIREKLGHTYLIEGENVLLHGYLHIKVIRATNLRNTDGLRSLGKCCKWLISDVSDPYVTVHIGCHRLVKTPVQMNNLDPEWNQDFYVPVCHMVKELEFRVKDWDQMSSEHLGTTKLSVHELLCFAGLHDDDDDEDDSHYADRMMGRSSKSAFSDHSHKGKKLDYTGSFDFLSESIHHNESGEGGRRRPIRLRRTGVQKTVHLDDKPHHGALEYMVEFIPKDLLHSPPKNMGLLTKKSAISMVVPGIYFSHRQHNRVRFYINADDNASAPTVEYGSSDDFSGSKIWKPRRFFRDVYDSISQAKHMVYIVGWSVDYTISLLRGQEQIEGLNPTYDQDGQYSSYIGELLNQKANEGVTVNMLVWDDNTSGIFQKDGVVATRDEQLRDYFKGTKVNLRLVPMAGGNSNFAKQMRQSVYYTHHQKCVICDTPENELVAYVGGIDLTYGRYDDGSYPLFRTLKTDHREDFHQACCEVSRFTGPREPWHDIHSRVQGEGTLDLLKNFEERWIGQGGLEADLVQINDKGIGTRPDPPPLEEEEDTTWCTQLYRSIDERCAKFKKQVVRQTTFVETQGVEFDETKTIKAGKRMTMIQKLLKTGPEREQHFVGNGQGTQDTITVSSPLDFKRDLKVDSSVHKALVHHIRNAQHTIYIESQYFLSSSFLWEGKGSSSKCCNLIAAEITFKICEKIEAGERFAAYIVVPMWPEGLPDASSVQDILHFQAITMRTMYKRIQQSIDRRREQLRLDKDEELERFVDITPTDYLNFYCLANREPAEDGREDMNDSYSSNLKGGLLSKTRRHLVYTHSKMTIVDDAIVVCGSANINQRSMDGGRDSELLMGSWQPRYLATPESVPEGDVHGFRLHCWAHLTGTMEEIFKKPSSLECVRRINEIAQHSWELYTQEEVAQMTSFLVPYPVRITPEGDVVPVTENGKFPDTRSNIQGGVKPSLPKFLTT